MAGHNFSTHLRFAGTDYLSVVMHHGREAFFAINGATPAAASADLGVISKTDTGWQFTSTDNQRFTFDNDGKLTQWSNSQGTDLSLTYSGAQVTVTDNFGNSLSFTEDSNRQPLTLSAPGIQIAYAYNSGERLTSVTRALDSQTVQRQFHYEDPRNDAWLTGITDERGVRHSTWSYDEQGRATSSERAGGADRVSITYNSDSTVSVTNELGKVTKYSFQYIKGVNRIISIQGEPSANCPSSNSSFTYDARGLIKTRTDNMGILTTYDHNDRGLEIQRTQATGTPLARSVITEWHPTLFLPLVITEPERITRYQYDTQGRLLSRTLEAR